MACSTHTNAKASPIGAGPRKAWVIDLDGVVWLSGEPIAGAGEAVQRLLNAGIGVLLCSNNSSPSHSQYADRLLRAGIDPARVDLVSSADSAASLVQPGDRVLALGGDGLYEALEKRGARVILPGLQAPLDGLSDQENAIDAVVVGFDQDFNFYRLTVAQRAVRAGAKLIGTNEDVTHPTPSGLVPGTGAVLAAVAAASETTPVVAGKPHEPIVDLIRARLPEHCQVEMVAGDRLATDGKLAERIGAPFGFVRSEVNCPPSWQGSAETQHIGSRPDSRHIGSRPSESQPGDQRRLPADPAGSTVHPLGSDRSGAGGPIDLEAPSLAVLVEMALSRAS